MDCVETAPMNNYKVTSGGLRKMKWYEKPIAEFVMKTICTVSLTGSLILLALTVANQMICFYG